MTKTLRFLVAAGVGTLAVAGMVAASAQGGRTKVTWFVGLGTGASAAQIPVEKAAVDRYNKSQEKIELVVEFVENSQAKDQFATRLAAGNAPDIVGPVGTEGAALFKGQWIDLDPLVTKYKPDLKGIDDALVKFYKESQNGEGLPYAVYPSFLFVNKDIFDEAKLPYPPTKFGEKYQGKNWDWTTLREVARKLTVDANGNDATQRGFDVKKAEQFGFINQWNTSLQGIGTTFGAGILIDAKGKVQIPANWIRAWQYYHNAIWKDNFMPNQDLLNTDLFGKGNAFNSGSFAMGYTHLWYTCCLDAPGAGKVKNLGLAVIPAYNGKYTAKLHADTFRIPKASKNQDAAFQAMWWIMNQTDLMKVYGAFPANEKFQDDFIADINKKYAPNKLDWQVVRDSLKYVDNPSHEAWLPNAAKVKDILNKLEVKIFSTPNLNFTQEVANLRAELQRAFDEKK
jgi:multiple sugar transport system substrate-binding protein